MPRALKSWEWRFAMTPTAIHSVRGPLEFFENHRELVLDEILRRAERAAIVEGRRVLSESSLSLQGAAILLRLPREALLEEILARASAVSHRMFGRIVRLYAPCSMSSLCVNGCRYCTTASNDHAVGVWLPPARVAHEVRSLSRMGFRRIVLVAAESPAIATSEYFSETLTRVRPIVPDVALNVGAATEEDYRRWRVAGAAGIICFQETYARCAYESLHVSGPKSDYGFRLGALERAGRAGIGRLGLGVLLGLADPARDLLSMIAHARRLEALFPGAELSLSVPRLPRAGPTISPAWTVSDEELIRYTAILRLALPRAGLAISTREPDWLRTRLLSVGVTELGVPTQASCEPLVECQHEGGKEEALDHRDLDELRWDLEDLGYFVGGAASAA